MRDGDIYFWRWKDDIDRYMPYHCCSQKAIVKNGVMVDTFWGQSVSNKVLRPDEVVSEFKGNVDEMMEIRHYETDCYRREDIIDMRHSNDSRAPIYVKRGTPRDQKTMKEAIEYRIEKRRSEIHSAEWAIERLQQDLEKVNAGQLDDVFL